MPDAERTREQRLRRMAARQGLILAKSRRRDPRALDYGEYWLFDRDDKPIASRLKSLDEVERALTED